MFLFKFAVFLFAAVFVDCTAFPAVNQSNDSFRTSPLRIIGGETANIEDYPYQVLLMIEGEGKCGGSILSETFIITAAHCVFDQKASQLSIRAGSSFRTSGGEIVSVASFKYPEDDFDSSTYDYDIAILRLTKPLTYGDGISPVLLPNSDDEIIQGENAKASGWGMIDPNDESSLSEKLQAVELPQITTQSCEKYYGSYITSRMFCAGYQSGGKDTCSGDSGGPLVVDGYLVGITSWGSPTCAEAGRPGVFTKVSYFRSYIDSIINNLSEK
ncbi:trypsin-1-like isoform X2 [Rhynchophorus ferrugineus]|uniref:trypsin-1-like isoform X2 n=1 Tax=Rhynchophorus ferrugineus TaxID=354439 RepID=UPI003FCDF1E0